jgi:hypothetical protein
MVFLFIFSIILIMFHISSLRLVIRLGKAANTGSREVKEIDMVIPQENDVPNVSIIPAVVIVMLSLLEISYFVVSAYIFNDIIITTGAAILTGYSIYSLIKFLPDFKSLAKKPAKYFKEKDYRVDNFINFFMVVTEIAFCLYVITRILSEFSLFT